MNCFLFVGSRLFCSVVHPSIIRSESFGPSFGRSVGRSVGWSFARLGQTDDLDRTDHNLDQIDHDLDQHTSLSRSDRS